MEQTPPLKPVKTGIWAWLKKRIVPLLGLILALAIIIVVGYFYFKHPDFFESLKGYGYLGAFVISVVLNATVIIPVSNMAIIFSLGTLPTLSPLLIGLAGGLGAGIGEMTGYIVGRSGRGLLAKNTIYARVEKWVKRWGWVAVFFLSGVPLFFDIVGIIAGAARMPVWRFFLACWLGRTVSYCIVAYLAHIGFQAILPWFG